MRSVRYVRVPESIPSQRLMSKVYYNIYECPGCGFYEWKKVPSESSNDMADFCHYFDTRLAHHVDDLRANMGRCIHRRNVKSKSKRRKKIDRHLKS